MPSIPPGEHASLIISHYLRSLTERAGLRWTADNERDMQTLGELLGAIDAVSELDSIPPFERPIVSDRVTQVFERDEPVARAPIAVDPEWEKFQRWRAQRAEEERYADTRRMLRR